MAVGSSGRGPMRCLLASASFDLPSDWLGGRGGVWPPNLNFASVRSCVGPGGGSISLGFAFEVKIKCNKPICYSVQLGVRL